MIATARESFLLGTRAGWRIGQGNSIAEDAEGAIRLAALPGRAHPVVDAAGDFGGLSLPTGIALDSAGRVYILDRAACRIQRFDFCAQAFETLPCVGGAGDSPRFFNAPNGIAISPRDDLFVADTGNQRVQIFAIKGLSLRAIRGPFAVSFTADQVCVQPSDQSCPPKCVPRAPSANPIPNGAIWQPWDVAIAPDGAAYVSDYANGLIHLFGPSGEWRTAFEGRDTDDTPLVNPTHIALDRDGRLYVAQEGQNYVVVLDGDGSFVGRIETAEQAAQRFDPAALVVDSQGILYLSDRRSRRINAYRQNAQGVGELIGHCPAFEGVGTALALDDAGALLVGNQETGSAVRLEPQAAFVMEGRFFSESLDSRLYRCAWHRVQMAASIPEGCRVRVDTLTSETEKTLDEVIDLPESRWQTGQVNDVAGAAEWDCLIQSPPGRYLWLRVSLIGDGTATPVIRDVRVEYPRETSLRELPAAFRADPGSADFLDRFLALFDTIQARVDSRIENMAAYFDPDATPAMPPGSPDSDFLGWLAGWLALSVDRHWPEVKRRRLVREAHYLYQWRGTLKGLKRHVELYADVEPQILEHFRLRRWLFVEGGRLGDDSALWGAEIAGRLQLNEYAPVGGFQLTDIGDPLHDPLRVYAHKFTVFVPVRGNATEQERQTLERIVEMAKPAHTEAEARLVEPRLRIGLQATVGVDTVIGKIPDEVVLREGRLGYDTALGASEDEAIPPRMRLGARSRIGATTVLD